MFGIERLNEQTGKWARLWTDYAGAPLVYDSWAVKHAISFAAELDRQTGYHHRLCVIEPNKAERV